MLKGLSFSMEYTLGGGRDLATAVKPRTQDEDLSKKLIKPALPGGLVTKGDSAPGYEVVKLPSSMGTSSAAGGVPFGSPGGGGIPPGLLGPSGMFAGVNPAQLLQQSEFYEFVLRDSDY